MKDACVLQLDSRRNVTAGSPEALRSAIRRGADLRIYTQFRHGEHIDTTSDHMELIEEASDFPETILVEDRWAAAVMTLRQPVTLPDRFGERASLSLFLYNEDGRQAVARPYLDAGGYFPTEGTPPEPLFSSGVSDKPMARMHEFDAYGAGTTEGYRHAGLDIAGSGIEGTPVLAIYDGYVSYIGNDSEGYGLYVTVAHENGDLTFSLYAQLADVAVASGDHVSAGDVVGYVGQSGSATGPHLHLGVYSTWDWSSHFDPMDLFPGVDVIYG